MVAATLMVRIAAETTAFHTEMQRSQRDVMGTAQQMQAASGAVTALQNRMQVLTESYRIGAMGAHEYRSAVRTLKADVAELAATSTMTENSTRRLAIVGGQAERAVTSLGRGGAREARRLDGLVLSMGAIAQGGEGIAAGVARASSALSLLVASNPQLFTVAATIGLLAVGWEAVSKATGHTNDEIEKLLAKNRTLLQVQLEVNRAALARAQIQVSAPITDPTRFRTGDIGALVASGNVVRLTDENTRLTAAINVLDVATGHAARTAASSGAAHRKTAEEIQIETVAAMAATQARKETAAAAATWRTAQEGLTAAHRRATEAMREWREQANANVEAALKLARTQTAAEEAANAAAIAAQAALAKAADVASRATQEFWTQAYRNMETEAAKFFEDAFGSSKIHDFQSFTQSLLRVWQRMLAQMAAASTMAAMARFLTGPGFANLIGLSPAFHGGGEVGWDSGSPRAVPAAAFAGAPRLHGGLGGDEFPAILQRGERVIPKGAGFGTTVFNQHVNVNIAALDALSVAELMRSQKGVLATLVAEAAKESVGFRRAIAGGR